MKLTHYLAVACASAALCMGAAEYQNPVGAGDYPDPSVIRVGQEYWATATSSEWAPHFPLLHSRDLVNWERKRVVFETPPAWAKANFWAPEIAEHEGRYFVYYTARDRETNRLAVAVATASHPGGPYTDHGPLVMEPEGSIDGMAFTDEDGVRWLLWKNDGNSVRKPTPIWLQRLSDDGLKLIGERREILTNDAPWEAAVVEGPFVLRHGDYYYLFYAGGACCGRNCNYSQGVARARDMAGPWEKAPTNPIMTTNDAWRCPGHGSVVTDPEGRYWLLYHAYAQNGFVATGRQMLLDEIVFGNDGWPVINGGRGPSTRAAAPLAADPRAFRDDFDDSSLAQGWLWLIGPRPTMSLESGWLSLTSGGEAAGLAQSIRSPSFVAETVVDASRLEADSQGGLVVYGDRTKHIHLATDGRRVRVWSESGQERTDVAEVTLPNAIDRVGLRIASRDGLRFSFAVRQPDGTWREVGDETSGSHLPPWDRGVRIGVGVDGRDGASARFDYLSFTPDDGDGLLNP